MLVASLPLIDGTLLMPRILSNATDAPYLGEAAVLFALTRMPVEGMEIVKGGSIPRIVHIFLAVYIGFGLYSFLVKSLPFAAGDDVNRNRMSRFHQFRLYTQGSRLGLLI